MRFADSGGKFDALAADGEQDAGLSLVQRRAQLAFESVYLLQQVADPGVDGSSFYVSCFSMA